MLCIRIKMDGEKMIAVRPRMTHLFEQLGLEATEDAIELFIATHQLSAHTKITEADYLVRGTAPVFS